MRILLSGASSFTGFWFARELCRAGHEVTCTYRRRDEQGYTGLRGWRVAELSRRTSTVFDCSFGSQGFLQLAAGQAWDVYCHHAAEVTDYRSLDFDAVKALQNNTYNLRASLSALKSGGCGGIVLTGSVFEHGEGAGSDGLPDILPYGLSKALTSQVFRYEARLAEMPLARFVIPNPFGPYQEPRFLAYLIQTWRQGRVATVATPAYVRDNIHVALLAMDYRHFLEGLASDPLAQRNPSGIVGDQGAFAYLVARELRARLGWKCELELARQASFAEPLIRINTDPAAARHPEWCEVQAWDEIARQASDQE